MERWVTGGEGNMGGAFTRVWPFGGAGRSSSLGLGAELTGSSTGCSHVWGSRASLASLPAVVKGLRAPGWSAGDLLDRRTTGETGVRCGGLSKLLAGRGGSDPGFRFGFGRWGVLRQISVMLWGGPGWAVGVTGLSDGVVGPKTIPFSGLLTLGLCWRETNRTT